MEPLRLLTGGIFDVLDGEPAELLNRHRTTYGTTAPEPSRRIVRGTPSCRCGYPLLESDTSCPRCEGSC